MTISSTSGGSADQSRSRSSARDVSSVAGEKVADAAEQVRAAAEQQFDALTHAVRRSPLQATGIAAGIGFVIALLARR